jgi:hypothetical protein
LTCTWCGHKSGQQQGNNPHLVKHLEIVFHLRSLLISLNL